MWHFRSFVLSRENQREDATNAAPTIPYNLFEST
jgi:hypothetical protein